jgi:LacI family gluconate utilization system Gnt-I transcriptional repressor
MENTPPQRSRRKTGAVTLSDVAKLAGVAPITASRALNKPSQVSPDVLEKVKAAVERTGYVPNRMAGSLASAKSRMIAAIVPSAVSSVFMNTIEALNNTLFDAGYQLMLGQSGYSLERQEMLIESFIGRRPDGIFLVGLLGAGKGRTRLLASGIPIVETWDLTSTPMDMLIGFSHTEVGKNVAQYLLRKNRKKFAIVTASDHRALLRNQAFCSELMAQQIIQAHIENIGAKSTLLAGRQALRKILQAQPDTDAIFCSSDVSALGVVTEAKELGIQIPEQLAVVGFGDTPFVADMVPSLTTVRVNGAEIGTLAAQYLIKRAEGEDIVQPIVDIGYSIVERNTT